MKGDISMKKITLLLTIMAFVLAFGSAYAMDMDRETGNGITVFTAGPVTYDSVPIASLEKESYVAASGWNEAETYADLNNGITLFAVGPVDFDSVPSFARAEDLMAVGSAAGGLREDNLPLGLNNGITIFNKGVIDAD